MHLRLALPGAKANHSSALGGIRYNYQPAGNY